MKKFIILCLIVFVFSLFSACTVVIDEKSTNPVEDIYIISSTERLYIDEAPRITGLGTLHISMAKNESEGAQFVIRSEEREYNNLSISVTDLVSDTGDVLLSENVKLYRERFTCASERWGYAPMEKEEINTLRPSANVLIPMWYEDLNLSDTKKGENTIYYVDVTTNRETNAGIYKGTVILTHDAGVFELPFEVAVYDVTLPETPTYRTLFNYNDSFLMMYLEKTGHPEYRAEALRNAFKLMAEFKLSSTTVYPEVIGEWSNEEEKVANIAQYMEKTPTFTAFAWYLGYVRDGDNAYMTQDQREANLNSLALLEKYGIIDHAYNYVVDEPFEKWQYNVMHLMGDFLEETGYNDIFHNLVTKDSFESVKGSTNTWCPIVSTFDPAKADAVRATEGSEYWWYFCNEPPAPGISIFNDISNTRIHGWMAKDWDIKGILYWAVNMYASYWNDVYHGSADIWSQGTNDPLMLQGVEGDNILNRNICVPTLALVGVRDGIEDFDLLLLLEAKVSEKLDELGLDMSVEDAMDGYYDSMYLSVSEFPSYEAPDNILMMREHIFSDITEGVGYIMSQNILPVGGKENIREILIYVPHGEKVEFDGAGLVELTESETYDVYEYCHINEAFSDTVEIRVNERSFIRPIIATQTIKEAKTVIDFGNAGIEDIIKKANPDYADNISVVSIDGKTVLKVDFVPEMSYVILPPEIFVNADFSIYNTLKFNTEIYGTDSAEVVLSGTAGKSFIMISSDTVYEGEAVTAKGSLSLSSDDRFTGRFRLSLSSSDDVSATMYFYGAYAVSEEEYISEVEERY